MRNRVLGGLLALSVVFAAPAFAGTVLEDWSKAEAPKVPVAKPVTLDAKTTALLVLDMVRQGCNDQRRPRCLPTVPATEKLIAKARAAGVPVIYTLVAGSTEADILPSLAPKPGEPSVRAGTDKFLNTNLDELLKARGVKTVVLLGTATHGAVEFTASEAALRGYEVVIAADGTSADSIYIEQAAIWTLLTAPVTSPHTTLSLGDLINF